MNTNFTKKDFLILLLLCLIGLALRLDFLIPCNFSVDADEAIVGLMAKHILEGKEIPTFYYGQHYMGSLEAILTAIIFKFFGISNLTLKIIPLLFSILLIPLMYFIGLNLKNKATAFYAAILTSIPPVSLVIWSGKTRGGFIELVFIGALSFYFTLKALQKERVSKKEYFLISFLLGLGWWVNNQIIFFIPPISLVLFLKHFQSTESLIIKGKSFFQKLLVSLLGFFLGGLPFWIYNLKNDFISFEMFKSSGSNALPEHLSGLLNFSIPILLGAKRFWEAEDIFNKSTMVFCIIYSVIILFFFFKEKANCLKKSVLLLIIFILSNYAIFVLSSFGHLFQAPRYLLPSYIGIFTLLALALESMPQHLSRISLLTILSLNLISAYYGGRAIPGEPVIFDHDRVAKDHTELLDWLKENKIDAIRTNYWVGYRIAFESNEDVKFLVFQAPRQTRIESYREEIKAKYQSKDKIPLLLSPSQTAIIETALRSIGLKFKKKSFPGYFLLYNIEDMWPHLNSSQVEGKNCVLTASSHPENAVLVMDKDLKSRWGSGEPQKPGMKFDISFKNPESIRGISILETNFETDFPRGLEIVIEKTDHSIQKILDNGQYQAVKYYEDNNIYLNFQAVEAKKISLIQTAKDSFFDWSISEIIIEK